MPLFPRGRRKSLTPARGRPPTIRLSSTCYHDALASAPHLHSLCCDDRRRSGAGLPQVNAIRMRKAMIPRAVALRSEAELPNFTPVRCATVYRLQSDRPDSGGSGLVHFVQRVSIPQAAAVRRKLIAQHHFAFVVAKLQFEIHQIPASSNSFSVRRWLCRLAFHTRQIFLTYPTERFTVGTIHHRVVQRRFQNRSNIGGLSPCLLSTPRR